MKRTIATISLLSVLAGGCSVANLTAPADLEAIASAADIDIDQQYEIYSEVLATYVDDSGYVDYVGLQQNRQQLDEFLAAMALVSDETYASWSEADQIAFWINAYNAFTLVSIINQEPIKASIKDITGVWRFNEHAVQGKSITLDHMEHQILRVDFNEPRLHAAIVCAAVSCPPLRSEPFTGEALDKQLDDQVEMFLAKTDGLEIDQSTGVVYLSKIFDWFGDDWNATYETDDGFAGSTAQKSVLNFVSNYVSAEEAAYLQAGNYDVRYFNYDWSLNDQS
ncbi:MAG: DUF547 domain-containing protein [Cyanobacteria bacterium P01_C01_bin.70]